jgi:hypothetical protein
MKFLVLLILIWFPSLLAIGEWLLSWTHIGRGDSIQVILYVVSLLVSTYLIMFSVMGLFPIIMNILQFWFIDSIVKAHHHNVRLDAAADSQPADHEPLFRSSSDDDDEGGHVRHDIENPRPHTPSRAFSINTSPSNALDILPSEHISAEARSIISHTDHHSYPPSLASSFASTSTRATSPKPARSLLKAANRRRNTTTAYSASTLSDSHSIHQPQPRIPQIASAAKSLELGVSDPTVDSWSDSWDESGDWTDHGTKAGTLNSATTVHATT